MGVVVVVYMEKGAAGEEEKTVIMYVRLIGPSCAAEALASSIAMPISTNTE